MWKYRCKSHLLSLVVAFILGVLFGLFTYYFYAEPIQLGMEELYGEMGVSAEVIAQIEAFINSPVVQSVTTGFAFAGLVNIVLIVQYLSTKSPTVPFIFLLVIMFGSFYVLMIGMILVIPAIPVSLYGMLSLHRSRSGAKAQRNISGDDEIVRIYKIHHHLDESVKELAEDCRKQIRKVAAVYALGVVASIVVMLAVSSFFLLVILFTFFLLAFNYLLRYSQTALHPIRSLLYQKCDPEACASAIIYYSTNARGKVKLKHRVILAQALIYMDDPQLAMDVLIDYPRRDQASTLQYWSLMANIQYMLKDEEALDRCKEEAGKVRMNFGPTGVLVQSEEMASIRNKIDLMNGQLNTCKKYYLQALQRAALPFQQVDACYYIGMISFVQEDYPLANVYFKKVISMGNKMAFVEKAKHYQSKIDAMVIDEDEAL